MNESNLKFCLNALIQLLDEWGCNFFSWEKIFDEEEESIVEIEKEEENNVEIDFKKYIKNEDFLEFMMGMYNNSDVKTAQESLSQINLEDFENMLSQDDRSNFSEFVSNWEKKLFQNVSQNGNVSYEDLLSFMQLIESPVYEKILPPIVVEQLRSVNQLFKNYDFDKNIGLFNMSNMMAMSQMAANNEHLLKVNDIFDFGPTSHQMVDMSNKAKQIEKKYVFNNIFEIVKSEGCKKIFKYTFSEAAKIMRSSEIII